MPETAPDFVDAHALASALGRQQMKYKLQRQEYASQVLDELCSLAAEVHATARHSCSICEQPLTGGNFMTMLEADGTRGKSFAHAECYWRQRATFLASSAILMPPRSDLLAVVAHARSHVELGEDPDEALADALLLYLRSGTP